MLVMNAGAGPKPESGGSGETTGRPGETRTWPLEEDSISPLEEDSTIDQRLAYLRSRLIDIAETSSYQEAVLSTPDLNVWSIEGTDGAGKSSLAPLAVEILEEKFEEVSRCLRVTPKGTFERVLGGDGKRKDFIARVLQLATLADIEAIEKRAEAGEISPQKALFTPNSIIRDLVYNIVRADFKPKYLNPFIDMITKHGFPVGNVIYVAISAETSMERIKARGESKEGDPKNLEEAKCRIKVYKEVLKIIEEKFGVNIFIVGNDENIAEEEFRDKMKREISQIV